MGRRVRGRGVAGSVLALCCRKHASAPCCHDCANRSPVTTPRNPSCPPRHYTSTTSGGRCQGMDGRAGRQGFCRRVAPNVGASVGLDSDQGPVNCRDDRQGDLSAPTPRFSDGARCPRLQFPACVLPPRLPKSKQKENAHPQNTFRPRESPAPRPRRTDHRWLAPTSSAWRRCFAVSRTGAANSAAQAQPPLRGFFKSGHEP
jgi:hypothetical protein